MTAREPKSIDTLIGAGMRIEGDIVCEGVLRVQGDIVGNVSCGDNPGGALIVDGAGSVTGAVDMPRVAVRGRLLGPVRSRHAIEVHPSGSVVGDVAFKRIAIHAGGVVDGLLAPMAESAADKEIGTPNQDLPVGADSESGSGRRAWTLGVATAAVVAVAAGAWIVRQPETGASREEAAQAPLASGTPSGPAPVDAARVADDERAAPANAAPAPVPSTSATEEAPPPAPAEGGEKIALVKGVNANRPAGVFLLISNEPSALYRKARGEPGDGTRVPIPAGEKASVAIGSGELIRLDRGSDAAIFYQGVKVPRNVIESGTWISFVPK